MNPDDAVFRDQGFGRPLGSTGPFALVLVDFVVGFADPSVFGGGNIESAIDGASKLLANARSAGIPIAHSRIVFAADGTDANLFSRKVPSLLGLTEDAADSQIIRPLVPIHGELVVRKTVPSAFFGTTLGAWLTRQRIESVLVAGTTTSGCVRATVVDAMSLGFKPIVVRDCVGDRSVAAHESSLFEVQQKYGDVVSLVEAINVLQPTGVSAT
jgi:maleamate amidohydrolase